MTKKLSVHQLARTSKAINCIEKDNRISSVYGTYIYVETVSDLYELAKEAGKIVLVGNDPEIGDHHFFCDGVQFITFEKISILKKKC